MILSYSEGDLFESIQNSKPTLLPHIVNSEGKWGSGFVIPLGKRYPKSKEMYLKWSNGEKMEAPFLLGRTQFVNCDNIVICNMLSQTLGGIRPLRYDALVKCMLQVSDYAIQHQINQIDCPIFGAVRAGGCWSFIHELIKDCWISRNINVTVHYLPEKSPVEFLEWIEKKNK